uniref:Thioredoxin related transmembrane protein 1 n=1 Tax=Cyanoderma ruficeps TaxID=181631 RepID=A0A8C3RA39_9PASS
MQRRAEELQPKQSNRAGFPGYLIFPMDKLPRSWSRDFFLFSVCCFDVHRVVLDCIERLMPLPAAVFCGVKTFLASFFFPHKDTQNSFQMTFLTGLSGRFIITALPTIYHCKDGEFRRYQGARTKAAFINFISDEEWKSIEPVSSWFGPSSFLMSSMSALFKLSMWIRVFAYISASFYPQYEIQLLLKRFSCLLFQHGHGYLTENLGIPVWGSYAVFGLTTLFLGMVLGLMMVFLADCICPSKRQRPPQLQPQPRKQGPESAHLLKNRYEEHEADEGDVSDDEAEGKEGSKRDSSLSGVRQRPVASAAPLEES